MSPPPSISGAELGPELTGRDRAVQLFSAEFGGTPDIVVRAPGRVNLIGEHTDYNDGFVLPIALDHATWIAARRRADNRMVVSSDGYGTSEVALPVNDLSTSGWVAHVRAMAWALGGIGAEGPGWDGAISSDVPIGAGLSSSAALHVAIGTVFNALGSSIEPVDIARAAQRAENEYLGVPTGIMDQLVSATAEERHALLIDCRDLSRRPIALDPGAVVVVLDTSTRRELVDSRYGERRASCERTAVALGAVALRDVTIADLDRAAGLDPVDGRRARHVIEENGRTLAAAKALEAGDHQAFGALMNASHLSMRDLFEISAPALDTIVEIAQTLPGCFGARMTGGGFAGCAVALVAADQVREFAATVVPRYRSASGLEATLYTVTAAAGASYAVL